MNTNILNSLIGKDVTVVTNTGDELWIFIEDNMELRISNHANAWRFIKNNKILLSSADFYIPMYDVYDADLFSPAYNNDNYEPTDEEVDFLDILDILDKYCEDLETFRDNRFRAIQPKLEGTTVSEISENEIGDLTISLSNGIKLVVFKTLCVGPKGNYKLLIR